MRILVLNADYLRFQAWLYRRQPELENASYAAQMAARNASLFGLADFYSKNFAALGHPAAEIHVNNPWLQAAWAREHGMAVEPPEANGVAERRALPGWLERAVTPFKPMLRPLARKVGLSPKLDQQAENILLAQIEEFRPDLVLNQDVFHIDTKLMRRIKEIGNPIAIGQVGIEPSRGEDWTVYDLMISQLPTTVKFFRTLGVRAEVNHLAFEPAVLDVLPADSPQPTSMSPSSAPFRWTIGSGLRCWKRSPNATISNCGETGRRRCPPPRRCIAASRARSGAPTCIRCSAARASHSTRISILPAGKPETCGCSRRPASAPFC